MRNTKHERPRSPSAHFLTASTWKTRWLGVHTAPPGYQLLCHGFLQTHIIPCDLTRSPSAPQKPRQVLSRGCEGGARVRRRVQHRSRPPPTVFAQRVLLLLGTVAPPPPPSRQRGARTRVDTLFVTFRPTTAPPPRPDDDELASERRGQERVCLRRRCSRVCLYMAPPSKTSPSPAAHPCYILNRMIDTDLLSPDH